MGAAPKLRLVGAGVERRLVPDEGEPQRRAGVSGDGDEGGRWGGDHGRWPEPQPVRRDAFEVGSVGFDPSLQLVGSDPWGSANWSGLLVPTGAAAATPSYDRRYLFLLAWLRLDGSNRRGRIRGVRTATWLYALQKSTVSGVSYPVYHKVRDPAWKSPLGNVSFSLRRIPVPGQRLPYNPLNGPSLSFRYANSPALLFESLAPYVPPGGGLPPGEPLSPGLGTWYDDRFGFEGNRWNACDIAVRGGCDIGLFAMVQQMPLSKAVPLPTAVGLDEDDAFLRDNPTAQIGRVFGSFVYQEETAL